MGFFDDDPFDDILKNFFGESAARRYPQKRMVPGEQEERTIDFIETEDKIYFIFEMPGYEKPDTSVEIKGNELKITASKKNCDLNKIQDYLTRKLCQGISVTKTLPKFVKTKNHSSTIKNGVLEIVFGKK